jgi:hypothetical protein
MSTMSGPLEWIEENENTHVAQSGRRRYVISEQSDGRWAVGLFDGDAQFSAKVNQPRLAATLEDAKQLGQAWESQYRL